MTTHFRPLISALALGLILGGCALAPPDTETQEEPMVLEFDQVPDVFWGNLDDPAFGHADELAALDDPLGDDDDDQGDEGPGLADYENAIVAALDTVLAAGEYGVVAAPTLAVVWYLSLGTETQVDWYTTVYQNDLVIDSWSVTGTMTVTFDWTGFLIEVDITTNDGALVDARLLEGTVTVNLDAGQWSIHDPESGAYIADLSWSLGGGDWSSTANVHGPSGWTTSFDRVGGQLDISVGYASGHTTDITWSDDGSGSITDTVFNGGASACWDADSLNTPCLP